MKSIRNFFLTLFSACIFAGTAKAQLEPIIFMEAGYAVLKYKTEELPVFLNSYNNYHTTLTEQFELKLPAARGPYLKFGIGFGGTARCILDFTIYNAKSPALSARFADGTGRDIWVEHRLSNTNVGVRFGDTKEIPVWGQFNINIAVQNSSLYFAYVYADGARSFGIERNLSGVYSDFNIAGGLGVAFGIRVLGPVGFTVGIDRIGVFERKKGIENHKYSDLNNVKPLGTPDYIPRDMATYVADPANSIGNSIGNDFRGWKFTGALTLSLGNWGKN